MSALLLGNIEFIIMGEITPIEQPLDREIKKIKDKQDRTRLFVEELGKIREGHLDVITNYKDLNADEIQQAKNEIAEIDDALERADEAIRIGDMMISEKLERKARLSGQKPTE